MILHPRLAAGTGIAVVSGSALVVERQASEYSLAPHVGVQTTLDPSGVEMVPSAFTVDPDGTAHTWSIERGWQPPPVAAS